MRGRRSAVKVAFVAGMLAAGLAPVAGATDSGRPAPPPGLLDQARQGADAVAALGDRLPDVAFIHGRTPDDLRNDLLADPTLWVHPSGRLFYVEPVHGPEEGEVVGEAEVAAAAPLPLDQTFLLNSRPGAKRTIYLDFDGHTATGTAWGNSVTAAPYSQDADGTTFNDAEREQIQLVWQRVAEDYAPFDVNVTTQDPGYAAINRANSSDDVFGTRLVVGNTTPPVCSNCGGVAYVGVFNTTGATHDYYQPAWVLPSGVGTGAKNIAEAASHEVGHNLGLSHDGTSTVGYYRGHGDWAPIMGVGYYEPVTQWSKGEYSGANQKQDDLAVIQGYGLPLRADDHGDAAASATNLGGSGTLAAAGVISTRADVDVFAFAAEAGTVTVTASPAPVGPNLDIRLELRNSNGDVVASADPPASTIPGGLAASLTATVAAGTYYLVVDGVGYLDASTGWTDYASLGEYRLSGTYAGTGNQPPTAVATASPTTVEVGGSVTFDGSGSSDPEGSTLAYAWSFGDGGSATGPSASHAYEAAGTYTATLTVTDAGGLSATASVSVTVTEPAPPPPPPTLPPLPPTGVSASASGSLVTVTWDDVTGETGYEIRREKFDSRRQVWNSVTVVGSVMGNVMTYSESVSSGTYRYSVRAVNSGGASAWSDPSGNVTVAKTGGKGKTR